MLKVLFICSENRLRSPTAAAVFSNYPGIEARSAGTNRSCATPLSAELVAWADKILVMEKHHRNKLRKHFREALGAKPVWVLGIPDDYDYMDPGLVAILKQVVPRLLNVA